MLTSEVFQPRERSGRCGLALRAGIFSSGAAACAEPSLEHLVGRDPGQGVNERDAFPRRRSPAARCFAVRWRDKLGSLILFAQAREDGTGRGIARSAIRTALPRMYGLHAQALEALHETF